MVLRLGSTPSLQPFLQDVNISSNQKVDSLKLLKVVLKNLCDPVKSKDPKYRQLRLDNEKIRSKIVVYPAIMEYLKTLGFIEMMDNETNSKIIRIPIENNTNLDVMKTSYDSIVKSLELFSSLSSTTTTTTTTTTSSNKVCSNKKPKISSTNQLSEKQKARILLEEKQRKEREDAKKIRSQNVKLLKQDKYVRQNDENWTSGVSAACMKSGNGISTFRDRHGEN